MLSTTNHQRSVIQNHHELSPHTKGLSPRKQEMTSVDKDEEKRKPVHCWWECKMEEPLWQTVSRFTRNDLCQPLSFCDPMNCSLPGISVHGTLQARILEWVVISSSKGSYSPRDRTQISCIAGRVFTIWTTREAESYFLEFFKWPIIFHFWRFFPFSLIAIMK